MTTKILYLGDIVGKTGISAVSKGIKDLQSEYGADFILAIANSTTGGYGLGRLHAILLKKIGIDGIILFDNAFLKKDLVNNINNFYNIVRPSNYSVNIGKGFLSLKKDIGGVSKNIVIVPYVGVSNQNRKVYPRNPFMTSKDTISYVKKITPNIIIGFHSSTTSERQFACDFFSKHGASAVIGSGSKVLTSDCSIFDSVAEDNTKRTTAVITDCGRCGSIDSVGGMNSTIEIERFMKGIPKFSYYDTQNPEIQGVFFELDDNGNALSTSFFRKPIAITKEELIGDD